jgi:homoaconitase/3-isopropylmalate dehydratase large subunit
MRAIGVFFLLRTRLSTMRKRAPRGRLRRIQRPDASYEARIDLDVSTPSPRLRCRALRTTRQWSSVAGTRIDHAFIGSCGSGM